MKNCTYLLLLFLFLWIHIEAFAQQNGTGLKFDDDKYKEVSLKATLLTRDYSSLESKASLKKYCPTPGHQGRFSTCVGWSSAYAARTILEAQYQDITDIEEINKLAFSGAFIYKLIKYAEDTDCAYGTFIHDALFIMQEQGVPLFTDYNPLCPTSFDITSDVRSKASDFKIKSYARLFDVGDSKTFKLQVAKKALSQGNPIVIGMLCPESFYAAKDFWQPAATESPTNNYGGHAMCVIGYDDTKYADEGAFEVMNSWGTSWGNSGFMWIKYSTFSDYVKYGFELVALPKSSNKVADLSGEIRLLQSSGQEMTAKFAGNTKGIGYYKMQKSYSSGTRFRIYISNNEPAFVYAIGSDLSHKVFQIFPHKKGISAALNYKSNNVAIPDEKYFIEMDKNIGTDYLCILYSREPLDIEKIGSQIKTASGTFVDRLQAVFANNLVDAANVKFNVGQIKFGAVSKGKSLVAALVEIQHVE